MLQHLIYHLAKGADADAANAGAAPPRRIPGEGQEGSVQGGAIGRGKWDEQRERVLHVMSGVLDVDL